MQLRCLDLRTKDVAWQCRVHAAGNKVTSLKCHPQVSNLLLTAGNDHYAKLFDLRMLRKATGKDRCVFCLEYCDMPPCFREEIWKLRVGAMVIL